MDDALAVHFVVKDAERRLATLVPGAALANMLPQDYCADKCFVLSRFAYVRRSGQQIMVETPLSAARLVLHEPQLVGWIFSLTEPRGARAIATAQTEFSTESIIRLLQHLHWAQVILEVDAAGASREDQSPDLQCWEFHDLLFHAHSRQGRHDDPLGAMYQAAAHQAPPPATKPCRTEQAMALYRPDLRQLAQSDPPLTTVMENRRSLRNYGAKPISFNQLGEFLFRVARVKETYRIAVATPGGMKQMDFTQRPYPSGGCLYPLELYAVVGRCDGLAQGLYHYDASAHQLIPQSAPAERVERILAGATFAMGVEREELQVLLITSARFRRVSWKYSALAYSLILKEVGVLMQNMYLAATAMKLAPCAMGTGDSDVFAQAIASDYFAETSVGEFALGSLPDDIE